MALSGYGSGASALAAAPLTADDSLPDVAIALTGSNQLLSPLALPASHVPTLLPLANLTGAEGQPVTVSAAFTDLDPNSTYSATLAWGDGTTSTGTVQFANGQGTVVASHTYVGDGSYSLTLTVTNAASQSASQTVSVLVHTVAPVVTPAANSAATVGLPLSLNVATFTDTGFSLPLSETLKTYAATINWGDNIQSAGLLTVSPGATGVLTTGTVQGSHVYQTQAPTPSLCSSPPTMVPPAPPSSPSPSAPPRRLPAWPAPSTSTPTIMASSTAATAASLTSPSPSPGPRSRTLRSTR